MKTTILLTVLLDLPGGDLLFFAIAVAVAVLIFMVLREFFCWYWKVNETLALLKDLNENIKKLSPQDPNKDGSDSTGWKRL